MQNDLSTAYVADACLRLKIAPRCIALSPLIHYLRIAGPVVAVRHYGSVDVFFEALNVAPAGSILVVDNDGRLDEGCIGDLVSLEAMRASLAGIIIWGCHRDSQEIRSLRFPLFSLGPIATGPMRLDPGRYQPRSSIHVSNFMVHSSDYVVADDDGAVFFAHDQHDAIEKAAHEIADTERLYSERTRQGTTLREQMRFADYLDARTRNPSYTFREHLESFGTSIEESFS